LALHRKYMGTALGRRKGRRNRAEIFCKKHQVLLRFG
jgi:hypothetical protein